MHKISIATSFFVSPNIRKYFRHRLEVRDFVNQTVPVKGKLNPDCWTEPINGITKTGHIGLIFFKCIGADRENLIHCQTGPKCDMIRY